MGAPVPVYAVEPSHQCRNTDPGTDRLVVRIWPRRRRAGLATGMRCPRARRSASLLARHATGPVRVPGRSIAVALLAQRNQPPAQTLASGAALLPTGPLPRPSGREWQAEIR